MSARRRRNLLAMIKQFGGGDFMTGILYILLILLAMILFLVIGFGFHSGARHARAQGSVKRMKGRHGKNLLGWICAQVTLLPVLAAIVIAVMRYVPVIRDVSGLMAGSVKIPPTRETLIVWSVRIPDGQGVPDREGLRRGPAGQPAGG